MSRAKVQATILTPTRRHQTVTSDKYVIVRFRIEGEPGYVEVEAHRDGKIHMTQRDEHDKAVDHTCFIIASEGSAT